MEGKKVLSSGEFEEICKEALPHIKALHEILGKREIKNICSLTVCGDGYTNFSIYDTEWELVRTGTEQKFRIRYESQMEDI